MAVARTERLIEVLGRFGTLLAAAKESGRQVRDPLSRAYTEGVIFALTIAHGELHTLADALKRKPRGKVRTPASNAAGAPE